MLSDSRPVYRYSVVRAGVYSDAEARTAASTDTSVRAHYKPVNLGKLTPVVLQRPMDRYVSFRRNNRIYWTSRRLHIPKGELLLSDGESLVRARCGNRLADSPQQPIVPASVEEPTDAELSSVEEGSDSEPSLVRRGAAPKPLTSASTAAGSPLPLVASPVAPAAAAAAVAAVQNSEQTIYPAETARGTGYPAALAQQSVTAASALTLEPPAPQVPRFSDTPPAPADPSISLTPIAPFFGSTAWTVQTADGANGNDPQRVVTSPAKLGTTETPPPAIAPATIAPPTIAPVLPPTARFLETLSAVSVDSGGSLTELTQETPEPGTLGLCLLGLAAASAGVRKRH